MPMCRIQQAVKSLFIVWSLLLCISAQASTEKPNFSITPAPDWIQFKSVQLKPIADEQSSETYLAYEIFRDISQPKEVYTFRLAAQINNTQGIEELSQVAASFYPSYEEMHWHAIDIIRDGKVTSRLNRDNFNVFQQEDELDSKIYDEEWRIMSVLEDVRVGDIVSYAYSTVGQNPIFAEHKLGRAKQNFGVPIEYTNFIVRTQKTQPLYFKMHNLEAVMQTYEQDNLMHYRLEQNQVPAYVQEDYMPSSDIIYSAVEFSSFKDWSEVNVWAQKLYDDKYQLDDLLKQKVNKWKASFTSKVDYANQVIAFVQKDIRYWGIETGVNSHLPSYPTETASRRYGDCKDKAVLLTALLRANDIESYPALVSASNTSYVFERLATPGAFDHVITTLFIDGKQYWVDGTQDSQGSTLENISHPDFKGALIIRDGENQLSKMQPGLHSQYVNDVDIVHDFVINPVNNEVTFTVTAVYHGSIADTMRRYINSNNTQKIDNDSLQYFSSYYDNIKLVDSSVVEDDPAVNTLTTVTHFLIKNIGKNKSARMEYEFYMAELRDYAFLPNARERKQAYKLYYPLDFTSKINVSTTTEQKPVWTSQSTYEEDFAEFSLKKEAFSEGNLVTQQMVYSHKVDKVKPSDFDRFKKNLESTLNNAIFQVWLPKNSATQATTKKRVKSLMQNILKRNQQ